MKKLLSILCLSIVVLTVASCKKETVVAPNTNRTFIFDIAASDWQQTTNQVSYYTNLNEPALDNYLHLNGAVLVYISFDGEKTYEQVPETYEGVAYSFSHQTGSIQVLAQAFDGGLPAINKPGAATIKVVLIDSDTN
ncbi:hypothetical protein [Mucilaginibacter phyllosphaerae]|uniref:Uncharacterized protein n=1 Tax=Mucilaginibacter phyllosphaerae TaxID=1812349 RepID=A0A4Y8AAK2_9SPHI|nr:hypothetical protein [Mucilaginibacter phyllosphaerae]MBB3969596.1 hypothetical protein [Mucilaginibacter phyllosphaerae]TEW64985.1 hypothetical protein E2R65_13765 [Mucilaginibacter phyllosphaerae]GGH18697.1 hypothetical protein GCM10007352_29590 [Mucilaginibacter phyllosphaerae]